MVFQANKWGWKALAVKLLLAPLVAGSLGAPAFAQSPTKPVAAQQPQQTADPAELLKLGRKALAEGKYETASNYAASAAANQGTKNWGLFADTPDALSKDAKAAKAKSDKTIAVGLVKEARELFNKPTKSESERFANVEAAGAKIDEAVALNGGGSWLAELNPFQEKPDALKKNIDAQRALLRKTAPATAPELGSARATAPTAGSARVSSGVRPAKFELEVNTAMATKGAISNEKAQAVAMLKEGRGLLAGGKLTDARAKFIEAAKCGATFAIGEDNPDKAIADVSEKGTKKVAVFVEQAKTFTEQKDYAKAKASLVSAKEIAVSLDLWTRGIELDLENVAKLSGGGELVVASAQVPAVELPATLKPVKTNEVPSVEVPTVEVDVPKVETPKPAPRTGPPIDIDLPGLPVPVDPKPMPMVEKKPVVELPKVEEKPMPKVDSKLEEGQKLLDRATEELKRGELEMANKLAVQAHNGDFGVKADAQKLMVAIDAERKAAKAKDSLTAFDAVATAFNNKQYAKTELLIAQIEDSLLPAEKQKQLEGMRKMAAQEAAKAKSVAVETTGATEGKLIPSTPTQTPGNAAVDQAKSVAEAEMQQFRAEALQVHSKSLRAFEAGDTDVAVQLLSDFATKVKASKLAANRQRLLLEPIEAKLDNFRLIKRQVDLYTKEAKDKKDRLDNRMAKTTAEQQKQEEVAKRIRDIKDMMEKKHFVDAEKLALQAKQLDPDNETLNLVYDLAKQNRRVDDARRLKLEKEEGFLIQMNDAERLGPAVTMDDPVRRNLELAQKNRGRVGGDELYQKVKTPVERVIENKLDSPLTVKFQQASLREVIEKFQDSAKINLSVDEPAIAAASIDLEKILVNENIVQPISLRSIMQTILSKHDLQYVVENDMVLVTTLKKAKGRMYTKVFSVMELVTPIPDFALPEHASLDKTLAHLKTPQQPWVNAQASANAAHGLGGGQLVSGAQANGWNGFNPTGGGRLENAPGSPQISPLSTSATLAPTKANHSEQLMKLIKGMVRPHTWDEQGGAGRLAYYDIGGALVVNQTADVINEINNLLESLRRLQDLSVAVEIRIVSLTESFFERIGVDFQMNIKTDNKTKGFEPGLTTASFRPTPFINDINTKGVVTGWNPAAGGFTSDLDVPIRPNTYGFSVPPFGGYPGNGNGGLNLGLAFLNDIQVFMFLEAAAGDRRANVMQAPKITTFNGATATVSVTESTFFVLGLQIINVGGQFVYLPQNTPIPNGVNVTVQPVVSSDRRFVRMTLAPSLTEITSATVPLFPITAFITPVFEGGSQGTPIPFTQFFQQPSLSQITVQTTVVVPDGGTVLMGGLKTMSEGRNEFGPPVLSNIPYLNRLFRNTGIGRETRHVMLMVTPRIIITSEEEQVATGQGLGSGN